jgi:hypothetical protein
MIALLSYPPGIASTTLQNRTKHRSFPHRIWELHQIIANPNSKAADVQSAKQSLLRALTSPMRSSLGSASAATPLRFSSNSNERSAGANDEELFLKMARSHREEMW